jgi:hypothetical protein
LGYQDEPNKTTILLNNYFNMDFDVVPPAPTIGLAAGNYLSTHDPITITSDGLDNTTIKYKWDDGDETAYPTTGVPFQAGTLKAWVVYTPASGGTSLSSEIVSAIYTATPDIATYSVTGNDNVTYNGADQTPTITVTPTGGGTALTLGTDYTVSYKKGETTVSSPLINAGDYTIVITAKDGSAYGGSKEVSFTIAQADLGSVTVAAIAEQTYTGAQITPAVTVTFNGSAVANDEYTIGYGTNTNVGEGTVTLTSTNKNFSTTSTKGATFSIVAKTLTVTPDNKTYNVGEAITLTVQYSGFVDGEDESVLTKEPSASYGTADITKPGSYTITVSGGEALNYAFVYETGTLTINRALGIEFADNQTWATYYATENLTVPEGLKAYIVTEVDKTTGTVTTSQVSYIPENQAVLLENTGTSLNGFVATPYTGTTTDITTNYLKGSADAVAFSSIIGGTVYVLYFDVFKRATSGDIPARRGYLVVEGAAQSRLTIVQGGNNTAIDSIIMDDAEDSWYAIDGRKLNGKPQRAGFYIRNGKKVYIK